MDKKNLRGLLRGPMVAVPTPFKEDFSLDLATAKENIKFMINGGVVTGDGALLVGAAGGEFPTMSVEERKAVMTASVEAAAGKVPVLSTIQHTDYRAIIEMAQHASKAGVTAVQLGPTYYYESTDHDVYNLFKLVTDNSDVPLMIYHTWWSGFTMSQDLLDKLIALPTTGAVKWSHRGMGEYRDGILAMKDRIAVIDNAGYQVLAHMYGSRAFVTHLSAFWPQYPLKLWRQMEAKDYDGLNATLAMFKWKWSKWVGKVVEYTGGEGPFIKAAMEEVGLKAGPPRPPSARPTPELIAELRALLKEAGAPTAKARAKAK
ncbi:MAG: dihydrodipicolinate synthase family protein [SAR202 cluster bacterium]|nr:dihydrodipicolinate synthase family protein [SAR202 cluster bacterium]